MTTIISGKVVRGDDGGPRAGSHTRRQGTSGEESDSKTKGSSPKKKTTKKGDIVPFGDNGSKRVKRGHLSSDYRQKCVNATRDMLM